MGYNFKSYVHNREFTKLQLTLFFEFSRRVLGLFGHQRSIGTAAYHENMYMTHAPISDRARRMGKEIRERRTSFQCFGRMRMGKRSIVSFVSASPHFPSKELSPAEPIFVIILTLYA